jgi:HlyD family secretion protein
MKKIKRSKLITWSIIGVVVLAIIALTVVNNIKTRQEANASLQTQELAKGDLTAIVGATGTVRANQTATLTWQTSGRVEMVSVEVGDLVKTADTLARLTLATLPQNVILAQSELVTAQRDLDNLLNSNTAKAQAQLNLANAQKNYDKVRWNSISSDQARETSQNVLDSAQASVTLAEDKVEKAQDAYDRFSETPDSDPLKAGALNNLANAKKELDLAKLNLNFYTSVPNPQEVSISQGEIAVAKATLEDAQREWDRLKDGPDPDDIAAAKARVAAIEATLNMASIRSPFTGTVSEAMGMAGDLVNPGTTAFRVDDMSQMFVDVLIPEVDINRVKVGQPVQLTFDAIYSTEYEGRVTKVARVGTTTSGAVNFNVTIEVKNPNDQVLPGMTAAVNIVVSNVKDVLIVPNRAVRLLDGQRVIYLLENGIPTPVNIEIGSSSDTDSEIISGEVKAGDTVILNPSVDFSSFMTGGRPPF